MIYQKTPTDLQPPPAGRIGSSKGQDETTMGRKVTGGKAIHTHSIHTKSSNRLFINYKGDSDLCSEETWRMPRSQVVRPRTGI